ncbi:MAG: hypothetical protein ACK58T_46060, partial [Phycisphaerae bacterium]
QLTVRFFKSQRVFDSIVFAALSQLFSLGFKFLPQSLDLLAFFFEFCSNRLLLQNAFFIQRPLSGSELGQLPFQSLFLLSNPCGAMFKLRVKLSLC